MTSRGAQAVTAAPATGVLLADLPKGSMDQAPTIPTAAAEAAIMINLPVAMDLQTTSSPKAMDLQAISSLPIAMDLQATSSLPIAMGLQTSSLVVAMDLLTRIAMGLQTRKLLGPRQEATDLQTSSLVVAMDLLTRIAMGLQTRILLEPRQEAMDLQTSSLVAMGLRQGAIIPQVVALAVSCPTQPLRKLAKMCYPTSRKQAKHICLAVGRAATSREATSRASPGVAGFRKPGELVE